MFKRKINRSSHGRCSIKNVFLKIPQVHKKSPFLIKLQVTGPRSATFLKKNTPAATLFLKKPVLCRDFLFLIYFSILPFGFNLAAQISGQRLALGNQRILVRVRLLAKCRGELSVVITRPMPKCLEAGGNGSEELKKCPPLSLAVLRIVNGREGKPRWKKEMSLCLLKVLIQVGGFAYVTFSEAAVR